MKEKKTNLKRIITGLFCFIMLSASMLIPAQKVYAAYELGDHSIYTTKYLKSVYPQIKEIGEAYVVGTDGVADMWGRVSIEKVPLGTVIQGVTIDEEYLDQNNMANLEALYSSVITANKPNYDKSIAYKEGEEAVLHVVALNGDKVIFWSNGYRAFPQSGVDVVSCSSANWLLSHPPGFYQISVNQVWLNIPTAEYNVIPAGQENNIAATGNITSSGLAVMMKPSKEGRLAHVIGINTKVSLASTEKIAAIDGSDTTYYKLIFEGTTAAYMRSKKTYCYVNSRFVDVDLDGADKPSDLEIASIINVGSGKAINVRSEMSQSSSLVGQLCNNTNVKYSPSGSNGDWTMLWFSGQRCYIPSKYVQNGKYIRIAETGRLAVKDIVDGKYVVRWDPINTNKGYTIAITTTDNDNDLGKFGWYWLYKNSSYTETEFTIDSSYFKDGDKNRSKVYFRVTANGSNKTLSMELPRLSVLEETKAPAWNKKGGILKTSVKDTSVYINFFLYGKSAQMQIATDKKFTKNVQTKEGTTANFNNLKSKKTYYVRFRHRQRFTTVDGDEISVYGPWSKAKKIKTKETTKYKYVKKISIKDVKKDQYVVTWNKPSGTKSYTVKVTENKTGKVLYRKKDYKKNTLTIKNKWFKKGKKEVVVSVESKKKNPYGRATLVLDLPTQTPSTDKVKASTSIYSEYRDNKTVAAKCKITITAPGWNTDNGIQVQFSKDTNFDNAEICENSTGVVVEANGFDAGKTYYYRYRYIRVIETSSGDKYLYGNWSEPIKVTTPDQIKEVVIEG